MYILSSQQPHERKRYQFRDFVIVRINKDRLVQTYSHRTIPDQLILVRGRIYFPTGVTGQESSTFVYNASNGDIVIRMIGDMLTEVFIHPPATANANDIQLKTDPE